MKYAIIESGGKQIKAVEGSLIDVDLMMGTEIGSEVVLDQVLFVAEDEKFLIGTPVVKGAKVTTTVADHVKGPKLIIFKYQPKKTHSSEDRSQAILHPVESRNDKSGVVEWHIKKVVAPVATAETVTHNALA